MSLNRAVPTRSRVVPGTQCSRSRDVPRRGWICTHIPPTGNGTSDERGTPCFEAFPFQQFGNGSSLEPLQAETPRACLADSTRLGAC